MANHYQKSLGYSSRLFNGRAYSIYQPQKEEHPYLYTDWTEGEINYDNHKFDSVLLLYDLSIDELVTKYFNSDDILLTRNKVSYFILKDRKFVLLNGTVLPNGFYELLYDGTTKVYSQRKKKFIEKITSSEVDRNFEEKVTYFVYAKGNYHTVKSKRSFLKIFPEQQAELKKFIRGRGLQFGETLNITLVYLMQFYDRLQK